MIRRAMVPVSIDIAGARVGISLASNLAFSHQKQPENREIGR
jgi:hypothetical protein